MITSFCRSRISSAVVLGLSFEISGMVLRS